MSQTIREIKPQAGKQEQFLSTAADIAIFGGAAGAGKTFGILMEPLRHINNGDFGAVFFRRTTKQIRNEGGLWDEAGKIYPLMHGQPNQSDLHYTFPSGCRVSFCHLEHEKNKLDWQGAQIPLIIFDEVTHFTEGQFWYLVSRNRSVCGVKPYIRATCNPDPDSFICKMVEWWLDDDGLPIEERSGVLRYFVRISGELHWADTPQELSGFKDSEGEPIVPKSFTFIAAKLSDNKALMKADPSYEASLQALPDVERERLLHGNWKIKNTKAKVFDKYECQEIVAPENTEFFYGSDWGFANDPNIILRSWMSEDELTIFVDYQEDGVGIEIDDTPQFFDLVPDCRKHLVRADSARPETISYMQRKGFMVEGAVKGKGSVEDGIAWLKSKKIVYHPRCKLLGKELRLYSYKQNKAGDILPILEDKNNHCIDALRYAYEPLIRQKDDWFM